MLQLQRPSFKPDLETVINRTNTINLDDIVPKRSRTSDIIERRQASFLAPDPIGRKFVPFDKLLARKTFEEGLKVRLGPSTMKKIIGLSEEQKTSTVNIEDLMRDNNTLLTSVGNIISAINTGRVSSRQEVKLSLDLITQLIREAISRIPQMTREQQKATTELAQGLIIDRDPMKAGLPSRYITKENSYDPKVRTNIMAYLMNAELIDDPGLTPERPARSTRGVPLLITTIASYIQRGQVLDVLTRQMLPNPKKAADEMEDDDDELLMFNPNITQPSYQYDIRQFFNRPIVVPEPYEPDPLAIEYKEEEEEEEESEIEDINGTSEEEEEEEEEEEDDDDDDDDVIQEMETPGDNDPQVGTGYLKLFNYNNYLM